MSKGSKQRPTDQKKYADNYDRIFNTPLHNIYAHPKDLDKRKPAKSGQE